MKSFLTIIIAVFVFHITKSITNSTNIDNYQIKPKCKSVVLKTVKHKGIVIKKDPRQYSYNFTYLTIRTKDDIAIEEVTQQIFEYVNVGDTIK